MIVEYPLGSWTPDAPDTDPGLNLSSGFVSSFGSGMRTFAKLKTISTISLGDGENLEHGVFLPSQTAGSERYVFAHSNDGQVYVTQIVAGTGNFFSISGSLNTNETGRPFFQWGNKLVFINGQDEPRIMDIDTLPGFSNMITGTLRPKCLFGGVSNNYIVLARDDVNKDTIYWSALNNETSFDPSLQTGAGNQKLVDIPGPITGLSCGETNLVFKERGVFLMTYEGHPFTFNFRVLSSTFGTVYPGSIVEKGRNVYFFGADGFKRIVDRSYIEDIGVGKVESFFRATGGNNQLVPATPGSSGLPYGMQGAYDHSTGMIVWAYGTTLLGYNCLLMFDDVTGEWFFHRDDTNLIQSISTGPFNSVNANPAPGGYPLSSLVLTAADADGSTGTALKRFSDSAARNPYSFTTKRIPMAIDNSPFIRAVRLVARFNDATVAVPDGTFEVTLSNDPAMITNQAPVIVSTPSSNGWYMVTREGQYCKVKYSGSADSVAFRYFDQLLSLQFDAEVGGAVGA